MACKNIDEKMIRIMEIIEENNKEVAESQGNGRTITSKNVRAVAIKSLFGLSEKLKKSFSDSVKAHRRELRAWFSSQGMTHRNSQRAANALKSHSKCPHQEKCDFYQEACVKQLSPSPAEVRA